MGRNLIANKISYREAINTAIAEALGHDHLRFIIGEDIGRYGGAFGVTRGLLERFGAERVIETPISELSFVGVAIGSAMLGMKPIVEVMFMDFITLAMDQIFNHLIKYPVMYGGQVNPSLIIRTATGAGKSYGPTHSQSLESWFLHCPGLTVVMPSTPSDALGLFRASAHAGNPVLFIEHKMLYTTTQKVQKKYFEVPLGKANVILKGGSITMVSYSRAVHTIIEGARILAKEGIFCEVIDLRTLAPLDVGCISDSVRKTGRLIVVEEGTLTAGVGAEICARIQESVFGYLRAPIKRIASPDIPVPFAQDLEREFLPQKKDVIEAVYELMEYS